MSLQAGSRLGPYEILAPLGAGGMGEVYRARDTRLERTVAVKVLPNHLSSSPEIRQRFEREARTISQLSHPHICALYDLGHQDETAYLVLEYLEGETLADRLAARGALPLELALRYGVEIADALERAHRHGIVHRDLKPGNVMLTPSGVKILDFGLAKALAPASSASALTALAEERPLTATGTLLGTVQYMAPEQLEGREADARTDIFALGLVLYEMVTGKRAFSGATQASLIGAVLRDEPPPISRQQPLAPRSLDRLIATCLAKEPEERWQTARDVALQLEGIREERSAAEPAEAAPARRRRAVLLPWALAATAAVTLAIVAWTLGSRPKVGSLRAMTTFLTPPPGTTFHVYGPSVGGFALSPDGSRLAFVARDANGSSRLWMRDLAAVEAFPVPGGEEALYVFWSPDSGALGFFAKGRLKVIEASPAPSPPRELADVVEARGASWGPDGTILYAESSASAIWRVPAAGGTPRLATELDTAAGDRSHRWPHFLPDGRRFLYEVRKAGPDPEAPLLGPHAIVVGSLDGTERRPILSEHTNALYSPPGYLLFRRGNNLMAAKCDPQTLELRSEPAVLAPNVEGFAATGFTLFSATPDLLVYAPEVTATRARVVWLDRSGRELATVGAAANFTHLALAPDGRSAVVSLIQEPLPPDLWLYDTGAGRGIRLTRDNIPQVSPVISADGQRIFFSSFSRSPWDIGETTPAGAEIKSLLHSDSTKVGNDASPDGRYLLYREFDRRARGDLKVVSLDEERRIETFLATPDDESNGDFSPDGRWVAYESDESGRREIYAASFPTPVRRVRVSSEGGVQPRWSRDGKELFYLRSGQLVAVAVASKGDDLTFGESRSLFRLPLFTLVDAGFNIATRYDVSPDGRFLALVRAGDEVPTPLILIQNWTEKLEKR